MCNTLNVNAEGQLCYILLLPPHAVCLASLKASSSVWRKSNVAYFRSHIFSRLIWQLSPLSHRSLPHLRAHNRSRPLLEPICCDFPLFVFCCSHALEHSFLLSLGTIPLVSKLIFTRVCFFFCLQINVSVVLGWEDKQSWDVGGIILGQINSTRKDDERWW